MNFLADGIPGLSDGMSVVFTVLMGVVVVFLGMAVIVLCLILIGKIFDAINNKKPKVKPDKTTVAQEEVKDDGIDEKVKVAIISAIYMYYLQQDNKCDFIVKKIKRI